MKLQKKNGFTLVEVIVVVIVLAILAAISFVSYRGYTVESRNASRSVDITNVSKAVSMFFLKANKYPLPDDIYSTWVINGKTVSYLWYVWDGVSEAIGLSKTPIDPFTLELYPYAVNANRKQYQIAQAKEGQPWYFTDGNYKWLLATEKVPSMIFIQTGSVELSQPGISYVMPEWILVGTWITKTYVCNDMTDAQVAKLNAMVNNFPSGNRIWSSSVLWKYYYVWDILWKQDWCTMTELNIDSTNITTLPLEIWYLNSLIYLQINSNPLLTAIPNEITQLKDLVYLYVRDNALLHSFPQDISNLIHLYEFTLSWSPNLWVLPFGIDKLTWLQLLELRKIWITSIPASLWNLTQLSNLNLACNQLSWLPPELSKLKNLNVLDIGWGYAESNCWLNSALWALAQSYVGWDSIAEICENVPKQFCIKTNTMTSKVVMKATPNHTCSSSIIANADFTYGFPLLDDTPWQNTDKNLPCFYKCKIWYSGADCWTALPLTLYERMIWYLQQEQLLINKTNFVNSIKEFGWQLYFQVAGNLYRIDSSSNVEIVTWALYGAIIEKNNKLYFAANHPIYWTELHIIDSSWNLTVIDWNPSGSMYPRNIIFFNNTIYFAWYTATYGSEIYYIDSTNQVLPVEITPWDTRSLASDLTLFNNNIYFTYSTSDEGTELYSINASNIVSSINPIPGTVWSIEKIYLVYNNKLFFKWYNRWIWDELYYINTSNTLWSFDINPWSFGSSPEKVMTFNNKLYFIAYNSEVWQELFSIDTFNILTPIDISSWLEWWYGYSWPIEFNNKLFYTYDNGSNGNEVYWVNTSNIPTLYDVNAWSIWSQPWDYKLFNNKLYFVAQTQTNGREFYSIDSSNNISIYEKTSWNWDTQIQTNWIMDNKIYFFNPNNSTSFFYLRTDGTFGEDTGLNIESDLN